MRNASIPAAVILLLVATASLVSAATAPSVTILSPKNGAVISGSGIEISVSFTASSTQPVSSVQINLDGKSVTERAYESPLASDACGFLWDTVRTEDGQHRLDVQIYSGKVYLGMATSIVTVANKTKPAENPTDNRPVVDIKPPTAKIASPKEGETVSGKVPVIIQAGDDSGKSPYVSVFVDKSLKAVTNHEPYTYTWDSSEAENGPHEIHIAAVDEAENRTVTSPTRVIVRNAGKINTMVTEDPKISAPKETSTAAPTALPETHAESARTEKVAPESFEVALAKPAAPAHISRPAPVGERVEVALAPEPEVAVLVTGPTEVHLAAAAPQVTSPAPAVKAGPVEVASAKIDEPKKPVTTSMPRVESKTAQYVVQSGDALYTLAQQFGTTVDALVETNGIKDPSLIRAGQKLEIPGRVAASIMVPLRSAFDSVGGQMAWDGKKHAAHAWAPGTEVRVWIGSTRAEVNDQKVVMERPAALKSGRTMVPRSFVAESLGMQPEPTK